jgi:hypothetical protein
MMAIKKQAAPLPAKTDTPEVLDLAAPVSSVIQVKSIRLVGCQTKSSPSSTVVRQQLHVEHRPTASRHGDTLLVTIDVHVWTHGEESERAIDIYATFLLTYEIGEHEFEQANLDAFAKLNGMFNLWPYIREFVQAMSVRMGLPALTLPVYRPLASKAKAIATVQQHEPKKIQSPKAATSAAPKKRVPGKRGS